ncbi:MAG: CPBP family intramembrane metalloprotease [Spirochaetes bacterium]|nr:CPBP family intramembrane metalloprotease [Spirochaetota bacterium]
MNFLNEKININKNLFYFLTFLLIPAIVHNSIKKIIYLLYNSKYYFNGGIYNFLSDNLFFVFIQLFVFFVFFIIIRKLDKGIFGFIGYENWIITFNKSLLPSAIAFGVGFFINMILLIIISKFLNYLENFFIISNEIRSWITAPNEGAINFINYLKDENYFKTAVYLTYIVVFIPFYEEVCFRGFLFDFVNKHVKKKNYDIIIVSFIFALFHIFSFLNTIFAFILSLFITKARKDTGNINVSIWMHAIINFTMIVSGIIYFYLQNKL